MPLNRLPDYISSNISLTGVSSDYFDGIDSLSFASALRANRSITGGGTITFDSSANLLWSQRFIVISNGRGPLFSTTGYFDIDMPAAGTVIPGVGGASNKTVSASGISLNVWEALYYILPIGGTQSGLPGNFRVALYTSDLDVPYNWVLIAVRNGDVPSKLYLNNGIILSTNQVYNGNSTSAYPYVHSLAVSPSSGTDTSFIELGINRTGDGYAYIDLIGDTTYSDFGLRIIRNNTGANTDSNIIHRGTGTFYVTTQDAASLILRTTNTNRLTIDSSGTATFANNVVISGDLTINGTTTNINTTNLVVEDKNIILGDVASPSTTTADGGGITLLAGGSNKTFNWINATDRWTSSVGLEASAFVPSSSTVPTNGMYLSAANQTSFSANSSEKVRIGTTTALQIFGPATADADPEFIINGLSGNIAFFNALAAGNYNPNTALNDKGIIFHNGSVDTGSFIIAPWSNTSSGLKITNSLVSTPTAFSSSGTISASGLAGSLLTSTVGTALGTAAAGTATVPARADHVHPTTGLGLTSGTLAQFAATTSAQLAGVISDETGSGSLVFALAPTIRDLTISRSDASIEGGQISLLKAIDNTIGFNIDVYGSTASPDLRIFNGAGTQIITFTTAGAFSVPSTLTASGSITGTSFIPSGSTVPTNGMYLPAANTVGFSSNSTQRIGIDANGTIKFLSQVAEAATVSATAAATTVTYDVMTNKNVLYYTTNATADWTFNVRGNSTTTLNTLMDIGQSLTVVFMNTNGTTAYRATAFQIDGTAVTPKWFGGSAPTAGNASSIDVYTYNIIKTAASTYTVLASLNKFA